MAEGILCAAAMQKGFDPSKVLVAEKIPERAKRVGKKFGVDVTGDAAEVAKEAKLIFLAVRPQHVEELAAAVKPHLTERQCVASIAAGKTLAALKKALGGKARLVRVMPNLALKAGEGMCAVCGGANAKPGDVKKVRKILDGAGKTIELKEKHFNAVTALSGSGPAFYAYMQLAMARAGAALGLPKEAAELLAGQTMLGTAAHLRKSGADLEEFIKGVATPGGTTAAGMAVMEGSGFAEAVRATLAAAEARGAELGKMK